MSLKKDDRTVVKSAQPNFEPLLQLIVVVDSSATSYKAKTRGAYVLRPFKAKQDSATLRVISSTKAGKLIGNWIRLKEKFN